MLLPNNGNKKANIQFYQHLKIQILSVEHITIPQNPLSCFYVQRASRQ